MIIFPLAVSVTLAVLLTVIPPGESDVVRLTVLALTPSRNCTKAPSL